MGSGINNFYNLDVWKRTYKLVLDIYKITKEFPIEECFGIISQIRRASSSIMANISEGFNRFYFKDKIRFYYQARGSAGEVQNFILLARGLKMIDFSNSNYLLSQSSEVIKLINGLIRSIKKQDN